MIGCVFITLAYAFPLVRVLLLQHVWGALVVAGSFLVCVYLLYRFTIGKVKPKYPWCLQRDNLTSTLNFAYHDPYTKIWTSIHGSSRKKMDKESSDTRTSKRNSSIAREELVGCARAKPTLNNLPSKLISMDFGLTLLREMKPTKAVLVCGLPGIAYVGKLTVDHLIHELNAELVGEVYSPSFPPFVLIGDDGVVELLKNDLYCSDQNGNRIFLFTGNTQPSSPEAQYEIAAKILDKVVDLGVSQVYSIAAFLTTEPAAHTRKPKVYGTTTNPALFGKLKSHQIIPMTQGTISGMNGLILGLAKKKGVEGICLLGETLGYQTRTGQYLLDIKAVTAVLEILTKLLGIKVSFEPLEEKKKKMEEFLTGIVDVEKRIQEEMQAASQRNTKYIT